MERVFLPVLCFAFLLLFQRQGPLTEAFQLTQSRRKASMMLKVVSGTIPSVVRDAGRPFPNLNLFGVCMAENANKHQGRNDAPTSGKGEKGMDSIIDFPQSKNQLKSIYSDAPAVLLKSGPGTGKTFALASRVAHLIQTNACRPERMVLLSFTNRDANALKERALDMIFSGRNTTKSGLRRKDVAYGLWSGTIHAFATNIIRAYTHDNRYLRVTHEKEMRVRVDECLHKAMQPESWGEEGVEKLRAFRLLHLDALTDVRQSRSMILHQVSRCIGFWKESGMIPPPSVIGIQTPSLKMDSKSLQADCVDLATRLGIFPNMARLAWELLPLIEELHVQHNTADPADVASLAYYFLSTNADKLAALRSKLKHVILDEYQDVSVAQHALIRLVIRGKVGKDRRVKSRVKSNLPPVLESCKQTAGGSGDVSFGVPRLFCCGDSNQSIYGWRGAAPLLSMEGFRSDFPQGIVVPLNTNFRLSTDSWNTVNVLIDHDANSDHTQTYPASPVGTRRAEESLASTFKNQTSNLGMETLPRILAQEASGSPTPSIYVEGKWDFREEAKHIVSRIRRRSRDRMDRCASALKEVFTERISKAEITKDVTDPTEVAVLVRSTNQIKTVQEQLFLGGIPYVICDENVDPTLPSSMRCTMKPVSIKPVRIMTMHRAKGEEFDDVYLPGWTEGVFPHPTAVSTDRVDEERRLAYVAISRARHQVEIVHSYVKRTLYASPELKEKYVSEAVKPSRFLIELVPDAANPAIVSKVVDNSACVRQRTKKFDSLPTVVWTRGHGSKEAFTCVRAPGFFRKSYEVPLNFKSVEKQEDMLLKVQVPKKTANAMKPSHDKPGNVKSAQATNEINSDLTRPVKQHAHNESRSSPPDELGLVMGGMNKSLLRQPGAQRSVKSAFRKLLVDSFGIKRGSAFLFLCEAEVKKWTEVASSQIFELESFKPLPGVTRPLSRCTALQLGLHMLHLIKEGHLCKEE